MLIKPSLVLQVLLSSEDYSDEMSAEIKRSYMHIAQSLVRELEENEIEDDNVMRLSVRIMRPFWDPADEKAQELWTESVYPWLTNTTRNVSTAMHNFNEVDHPAGAGNVTYEWAEYEFGNGVAVRVKVDNENRIPLEIVPALDEIRTLYADGTFTDDIALIRIPSKASLNAQIAAYETQVAEAEAEAEAAAQAAAANAEETDGEEPEEIVIEFEIPEFVLDYSTWGIEYTDGHIEEMAH